MKSTTLINISGVIFIILGVLSIVYPLYSSLGIEIFFGILFLFGGVSHLFGSFQTKQYGGYLWNLVISIIYIIAGLYLLSYPLMGLLSLTMLLIFMFYIQGIGTILFGYQNRHLSRYWGWSIVSGLLTISLATLLLLTYPISALWILGFLIGINFLIFGISILFLNSIISKL